MVNCASTQFPVSESGVIQAQQETMNKDAVRLKAKIISRNKSVGDRNSYTIQIMEVIDHGDTFAHAEPRTAEMATLYTPADVKFKMNAEVLIDALAPINRGEILELNMVLE